MKLICILFLMIWTSLSQLSAQERGTVQVLKSPMIDSLIAKRMQLYGDKKSPSTSRLATKSPSTGSVMGYRVQIYYGSDRREAFTQQARFREEFQGYRTYITYREPNYYLRVGDFIAKSEAQDFLNQLKQKYPTLFIFREKISSL